MKDHKERLEVKILGTINKIKNSPMSDKIKYSKQLEKYSKQYKELTGDYFRIETQGRGE